MNRTVPPRLRYRRLWFGLGLVIALAVAVVCLMPGNNLPGLGMSDKTKHAIAFAMLAFWFGSILARRELLWLVLALVAFGALIEIAQGLMRWGRSAEFADLLADVGGMVVGLLLALTPLGRWAQWVETLAGRKAT